MHPTWIEVDLKVLQNNLRNIRGRVGEAKLCLVVKANAYGHGIVPVGRAAEAFVDYLGVSCLKEGLILREAGVKCPILVLGAIYEAQVEEFEKYDLEFTISSLYKAEGVARRAKGKCRVHVEVEGGMQRTGMRPETALKTIEKMEQMGCFEIVGIYSHLATGDADIQSFRDLAEKMPHLLAHVASSPALGRDEARFSMVRVGLLAYQNCLTLKSRVSYFKVVEKGQGISYGHTYRTQKQTRIATVPIGYGDGYRRALSNKGSVLIRGKKHPIVGNICMDQLMVDIGNFEAYPEDEVVLIGRQGGETISLEEIAWACDTIPYEILCGFNDRVDRIYF
jgi:alanine racemase